MAVFLNSALIGFKRIKRKLILLAFIALITVFCSAIVMQIAKSEFAEDKIKINVALLNLDTSSTTNTFFNIIFGTKEITDNFNITMVDTEEQGIQLIENNDVYAMLIIPADFLDSLINGTQTTPTIVKNPSPSIESAIMDELTNTLVNLMKHTQSGIYTATEMIANEGKEFGDNFIVESNFAFINQVLVRHGTFEEINLSYEKVLPIDKHYALSFAVFFMILSSALFYNEMNIGRDFLLLKQFKSFSNFHLQLYFGQLIPIFVLYFLSFIGFCFALGANVGLLPILSILNATVLFMGLQILIFAIFGQYLSAVFSNVLINGVGLVLAGGIIPTLLMPDMMAKLSFLSPILHIRNLLAVSIVDVENAVNLNIFALIANIALYALILVLHERELHRRYRFETVF